MMAARERPARHLYVPPPAQDVVELPADRLGLSNGMLLRFPRIYGVGDLALADRPSVAIVGARKASLEGRKRAAQLARDLVAADIVVLSGLAEGIDTAAHTSAIEHGGRTIAVTGTPLDKAYPAKNAALQELIYREHLLISPFPWGQPFVPANFPERNRIMARMAATTVIIEATDTSGSLHQAVECVDLGKPVFIARAVAESSRLKWPKRFLGDDKPLGRILARSRDVIDFVLRPDA
jgi:DNA processing protein